MTSGQFSLHREIGANLTRVFSYVVEHDQGFAPNPYGDFCSLANCKPKIRSVAGVGDYLLGTGATAEGLQNSIIYWMKVSEVLHFDTYWADPRFSRKKPNLRGSRILRFGDNIYHTDPKGAIQQADSFHSMEGGKASIPNLNRDVGTTQRVLVASDFLYFGRRAPKVPEHLRFLIKRGPGHKCRFPQERVDLIIDWLESFDERGFVGLPSKWKDLPLGERRSI